MKICKGFERHLRVMLFKACGEALLDLFGNQRSLHGFAIPRTIVKLVEDEAPSATFFAMNSYFCNVLEI